jgi:hypothetical protein
MLAKIELLLVFNPMPAAGLGQALGAAARIIHGSDWYRSLAV